MYQIIIRNYSAGEAEIWFDKKFVCKIGTTRVSYGKYGEDFDREMILLKTVCNFLGFCIKHLNYEENETYEKSLKQRKDRKMSKTGTERFNKAKKEKHPKKESKVVLVTKKHLAETIEIYGCPRCDENGIKLWMFFCPTCGVKIRWSKECKGKG